MPVNVYGILFENLSREKNKLSSLTNALRLIVFPEFAQDKSVLKSPAITQCSTLYWLKQLEMVLNTSLYSYKLSLLTVSHGKYTLNM